MVENSYIILFVLLSLLSFDHLSFFVLLYSAPERILIILLKHKISMTTLWSDFGWVTVFENPGPPLSKYIHVFHGSSKFSDWSSTI